MKYSWKGHKDRNKHKNRRRKKGVGKLGWFMSGINRNISTTWRWTYGEDCCSSNTWRRRVHAVSSSPLYSLQTRWQRGGGKAAEENRPNWLVELWLDWYQITLYANDSLQHWSMSVFLQVCVTPSLWSPRSMVPQVYVPLCLHSPSLWSPRSMFPFVYILQVYVRPGLCIFLHVRVRVRVNTLTLT